MKKLFKAALLFLLIIIVTLGSYVLFTFPPIITGMGAKVLCSCVYSTGRTVESVQQEELQLFPLPLGNFILQPEDSSAIGEFLWFSSKAIYRNGLGCTLIAQRSEAEIRNQEIRLPSPPAINQDTIPWPSGDLLIDSLRNPALNTESLRKIIADAFIESLPEKPMRTHAIVVVYDGQVIGEQYAEGFNKNSILMGWSMTKSITNAMAGLLVKEGKLKIEGPAPVEEWQNDDRKNITLNNLLQASSGLKWSESYFLPGDFHNMFIHSDDKGGYAASKKTEYPPGEFFEYSSGTTNLLSKIIRQKLGDEAYYKFPYEQLFYKIGMRHTLIEADASGTFVGSSYGFASARDWARFGLLYLNDGIWNGERILPEGWVKYSTTPAPAAPKGQYGAQWWLNAGEPGNSSNRKYPALPTDVYMAEGFEEQYIMVVPSEKLVIVRLGVTHSQEFDMNTFVSEIIELLPRP